MLRGGNIPSLTIQLAGVDENRYIAYSAEPYNGVSTSEINDFSSNTGKRVIKTTYTGRDGTTYNEAETAPTNPGKYRVYVYIGEDSNLSQYKLTADFEIIKANIDSGSGVKMNGWTYGSNPPENQPSLETSSNPGNGSVTYSYYTDESCTKETEISDGATEAGGIPKNAGTYYVKAVIEETANYNSGTVTGSFTINRKSVTVKACDSNKHIGQQDPQFTYNAEGLIGSETLSGVVLKRTSGEDAGTYSIGVVINEDQNPNYNITPENGTFTINDHTWVEEVLRSATAWSEGTKKRSCTYKNGNDECKEERYYTIPKTVGESNDDITNIDKYAVIVGSPIQEATLNNKKSQFLQGGSSIFTQEEKEAIRNGSKTKIWMNITAPNLTDEQRISLKEESKKIVGTDVPECFFGVSLYSRIGDADEKMVTETGIPINIRIKVPDYMVNHRAYTVRNYRIIRLHNGKMDSVQNISFNGWTNEITFETDKLSVFALTYKDTYYSPSYPVTGIKLSPDSVTLTKKDETAQFVAEVIPSYADNKKVTWKSSDENVATVDQSGKVTAVGNGTASITATSVSGSYTKTVSVIVKIPVEIEKLTIEAEKETLTQIGETTELKVKIEPENADEQKLTWSSDDEKVVIVDINGRVTAVGDGTATITAATEDGKHTTSIKITVKIPVQVPEEPVINKTTGFGKLKARSVKQTKTSVTLQWSKISDADGYMIYGNRCNTSGKKYKYKKLATISDKNIRTWTQENLKKGTYYKYMVKAYKIINGKKVVTDISTSVHVVTQGGKYGVAKSVFVSQIGTKKNVSKITLKKGKTAQITATSIKKDNKIKNHRKLCYESSDIKVATVTSDGLIQAKGKGTCTIWVYAQNGVYKALTITVK